MRTTTQETREQLTPADALQILKDGNARFVSNLRANRNLLQQVNETSNGQWPFGVLLSCIDSRAPAELLFDQGIGDIFNIRIAGNTLNDDILGSMEFACHVAGAKLIVVLGHSQCGAIKGACDGVELGNLTGLLAKIQPAVKSIPEPRDAAERCSANPAFVQAVSRKNTELAVEGIPLHSEVLRRLRDDGSIDIVGGMYDVATGVVEFMKPA